MSDKNIKPEKPNMLREPKAKKKLGLSVPVIRLPHDDFINNNNNIKSKIESKVEDVTLEVPPPTTTSLHLLPPPTTNSDVMPDVQQNNLYPVSPAKDFTKVANSIVRDAIPQGLFKGTSKVTYDALYLRTRGAIVPVRTIKARFNEIMEWANVSHNTLRSHLNHLEKIGLIIRNFKIGDNNGMDYEIKVPEELYLLPPPTTSYHQVLPPPTSSQNVVGPPYQKLGGGRRGQMLENTATSESPNTIIKTIEEKNDDEPQAAAYLKLIKTLEDTILKLTGKGTTLNDQEQWEKVALVLASQIELIAARTTISNAPAILAKHLQQTFNFKQLQLEKKNSISPAETKALVEQKPIEIIVTEEEQIELKQMIVESISEIFEMKRQGTLQPWMPQSTTDFINYFRTQIESGIDFTEIETRFANEFSAEEWQKIKSEITS